MGFIVNIGHGTISKGSFFTDTRLSIRENCADLMAVPGIIHKKILEKYVYKPIEIVGMPKLRYVFKPIQKRESILKELGLDSTKKTILIAPTFNPELSIVPYLQDKISDYIPDKYNVILKLHGVAFEELQKAYQNLSIQLQNFAFYQDYDVEKPFLASDVLISDVSSIIFEFMAMGKPALVFNSPCMKSFKKFNPHDIEHKYRDIAYQFDDLSQIEDLLEKALQDKDKLNLSTQISRRFVSVFDGTSTEKLIKSVFKHYKKQSWNIINYCDLKKIKYSPDEILFFSLRKFKKSPNLKQFMHNVLTINPDIDIVSPLFFNHKEDLFNIQNYFNETGILKFDEIKNALSYRNSGIFTEIKSFSTDYFSCRKSLVDDFLMTNPEYTCIHGFIDWLQKQKLKKVIAFDALVKYL